MPKTRKKAAKALKLGKLPKQIAGVKIPKELRQTIAPVLSWAHHPLVNDTLAAALLAGATALTGKKSAGSAAAAKGGEGTGGKSGSVGLAFAVAAGEIASRIVASLEESGAVRPAARRAGSAPRNKAAPKKAASKKAAPRKAPAARKRTAKRASKAAPKRPSRGA